MPILILALLLCCIPHSLVATPWEMVFPAMGTVWVIHGVGNPHDIPNHLQEEILHITSEVETTFSDWLPESELRTTEKEDLTQWQTSSALFTKGLILGKQLYELTQGIFDLTVGRTFWLGRKAVGLQRLEFSPGDSRWRFPEVHPERLTFNGFIKGYTVGLLAQKLVSASFPSFFINAGGGDLCKYENGSILFLSRSGSSQEQASHRLHIFSPKPEAFSDPSPKTFASIWCQASLAEFRRWPEIAATADALSTTLVLKSVPIPTNCWL